ncbi:putative immunity protein [Chryseobacterium kwangjuense]|uniref:Immunity protein n=1 Tax=Chryseobacterium kwangjuense TaxID=267125 RepID=A0ABW9K7E8_9FLAO
MSEKPKIKILDNPELRQKLLDLVKTTAHIDLANWAISCAEHILNLSSEKINSEVVASGFETNRLWQDNKATVHQVRQAGFKVHEEARKCTTEVGKNILRTVGQAVAVGHMQEHAMVCSDYAIKTVQLYSSNDLEKITAEREWQINELTKYQ